MENTEKKKAGRPVGSKGKRVSKLRRILGKFETMCQNQAPQIIQDSLDGKEVDKEKLATAKWTVTTYASLHKACIAEEELNAEKDEGDSDFPQAETSEEGPQQVVFSMQRVK